MQTTELQARIDDLTYYIDFWTGVAQDRYDSGNTRGNIDAVSRMERLWDEREELRHQLRQASAA